MRSLAVLLLGASLLAHAAPADGIRDLADRFLDGKGDAFEFTLSGNHGNWSRWNPPTNDNYTIAATAAGKIHIQGTTLSALARGLRHYANDVLHVDDFWFFDRDHELPSHLPLPAEPIASSSSVPWRYNLNTVTFAYSFVWYQWSDWEKLLDWAALHGVNFQLAWVGYEKIYLDCFRQLGLADDDILAFFTGPAFQPWNRLGNIKGTWGPEQQRRPLSMAWIEQQAALQARIVARMVRLGITPILPAFPGFVPDAFARARPGAQLVRAPAWGGLPADSPNSGVLFLSPLDDAYAELQALFIDAQLRAHGNVTNLYAMDQFNEINPASGEPAYLAAVSRGSYAALTAANPAAVWVMQGWLFYLSAGDFWTRERVEAYLGGPEDRQGLVVLDLFAETAPQWQRTGGYAGRPWVWCQVHDFGGNQNLFGKITNTTVGPVEALREVGSSMVGLGVATEAYEGNEVVYDLFLDQAWSATPLDTASYFRDWTARRYSGVRGLPAAVYQAWELLRATVYDYQSSALVGVPVSVYQLEPNVTGLYNTTTGKPTALHYDPAALRRAWRMLLEAAAEQPLLWREPGFRLDMVDVTRQVLSNAFGELYADTVAAFTRGGRASEVAQRGERMLALLGDLDALLATQEHLTLRRWLDAARAWGRSTGEEEAVAYDARSQVTIWAPDTLLNDYAAKAWSGLVSTYYAERWRIFLDRLVDALENHDGKLDYVALHEEIQQFQTAWQTRGYEVEGSRAAVHVQDVVESVQRRWHDIL
ncbi:Alpha-N-acetylglucosaminidase [Cordyceps fumosorosea ARSEF 2679]|uniref:Alpha-N-acetylglucosaminidase n=1 Tax=Cordyceps fumosorosea (strain ARSEF 2679) TaxID=1081104 RepID=A0A162JH58_CORFA|nr:Alpha-N-acetylglucosaminidase [Cordyceps fumosorosea ARSEF 2679]OAA68912.1 Alpha-N-acetylglucosaminidase [Cordyceps fumosorosea ARSEF 2679]